MKIENLDRAAQLAHMITSYAERRAEIETDDEGYMTLRILKALDAAPDLTTMKKSAFEELDRRVDQLKKEAELL